MIPPERDDCGRENLLSKRSFRKRFLQRRFKDLYNERRLNNLATSTPLNHVRDLPKPTFGGMSAEYHYRLFAPECSSFKEVSRIEDSGVGASINDSSSEDEDFEPSIHDRFQSLVTSLVPQQYDFLKELAKIGGYEVTSHLLSYLSPKDLQAVSSVSRHYRNIVLNDVQANRRRCGYLIDMRLDQEEKGTKPVAKSKETNEDRVLFQDLTNKLPTVPKQPLENQSPKTIYDSFVEAGKKIHRSEVLMKCPNCRYPSQRVNGSRFCCTRQFCSYEFCRDCLGTFVDNHQCQKFQEMEEVSKIVVGSLKSRRNLRRL